MQYKKDLNSIVLLGNWNFSIFNPDWVSKFLLSDEQLKVNFPLGSALASPQIETAEIRISVIGTKLSFVALKETDDVFEKIEELGLKVADYLPHTPVAGYGINFTFETEVNDDIKKLLPLESKRDDFSVKSVSTVTSYQADGFDLNLKVNQNHDNVDFEFNFHFNIKSLIEFKEIVDGHAILNYRNRALSLMSDWYNLELDEQ